MWWRCRQRTQITFRDASDNGNPGCWRMAKIDYQQKAKVNANVRGCGRSFGNKNKCRRPSPFYLRRRQAYCIWPTQKKAERAGIRTLMRAHGMAGRGRSASKNRKRAAAGCASTVGRCAFKIRELLFSDSKNGEPLFAGDAGHGARRRRSCVRELVVIV